MTVKELIAVLSKYTGSRPIRLEIYLNDPSETWEANLGVYSFDSPKRPEK